MFIHTYIIASQKNIRTFQKKKCKVQLNCERLKTLKGIKMK